METGIGHGPWFATAASVQHWSNYINFTEFSHAVFMTYVTSIQTAAFTQATCYFLEKHRGFICTQRR